MRDSAGADGAPLRIAMLIPGTGHFICGSCLRDNALARGLRAAGHDVLAVPLYLPFVLEDAPPQEADATVRMGGINMYLQQRAPFLGRLPRLVADALDRPGLLRWAARRGDMTDPSELGAMTVSMLRGELGAQASEVEKLVGWLHENERFDLIVLSNALLVGLVRRVKERTGAPVLCTLQGEAPFLDGLPEPHRAAAWREVAERAVDVDAFVAVSRWYGDHVRERLALPAERVHVVHNGVELDGLADLEPARPERPTIGYLARMCVDKGLPVLVEAFARLKERGTIDGLALRVAGVMLREDERVVAECRARLAAAGCERDATFLPNVSRADKLAFLRSLSVLSVPATYGESFGLYVLEALAAGVPVVQPNSGAFPEIVAATGGGVLCAPDDPDALADALAGVLRDPDAARAMGARGRAAVLERFTSERMARGVAAVARMLAPT